MGIAHQLQRSEPRRPVKVEKNEKVVRVPKVASRGAALDLETIGLALHGEKWHSALARELGVSRPTLYKMVEAGVPLTPGQEDRFRGLIAAKRDWLNEVLGE